jgi:hypothetical protein
MGRSGATFGPPDSLECRLGLRLLSTWISFLRTCRAYRRCTLELRMSFNKFKIVTEARTSPADAPPDNDFTPTMTGLESLIHVYDAAFALDDELLKKTALAALRVRLVDGRYYFPELFDAMDSVYSRGNDSEQDRDLRRAFLAAAVTAFEVVIGVLGRCISLWVCLQMIVHLMKHLDLTCRF